MKMKIPVVSILFIIASLSAYTQDFIIKDFDVKIKIQKNGTAEINEEITVYFNESKRGIIRDIPYKYKFEAKEYKTPISGISVKNHKIKITESGSIKRIRIGDPDKYLQGEVVYNISYKVKGPFITNGTYDEFYWNITGNDWTAPIEKVKYDIELPDDVTIPYSGLKVFTGSYGSKVDSGYIQQGGRHIYGNSISVLPPGQGLTVSLQLPFAYIDRKNVADLNKTKTQEIVEDVKIQWPWAIIPAALISLFVGFWNKTRKRYTPHTLQSQMPYPPDDMNPAEVGAFYDHVVNDRDVISLLPYWAAEGFIRMEHDTRTQDTYISKLNHLSGNRAEYEYTLFNNLFANRSSIAISELKNKFHTTHSLVKSMIKREIIDMQLYDADYRYWFKSWRAWLAISILIPLGISFFIFGYWFAGIFCLIGFLIGMILLLLPEVVSQKGHRIHLHLKAFYDFLKNKDSQSMQTVFANDPNYFDKVYPYAVALNLDKSFVQKVKTFHPQGPTWYGWYGIPVMTGQRTTMEDFGKEFEPKEITTAFNSVPMPESGSFSGGSSGGGFSGGGFGGGGGSSW